MTWTTYKERLHRLSELIVDAQRPIRVLDSIKWDPSVLNDLKKSKYKDIPDYGPAEYAKQNIGFDPDKKKDELKSIKDQIESELGKSDPIANLLTRITDEYYQLVDMLLARGTPRFWEISKALYGSPKDRFDDKNQIRDLGFLLYAILGGFDDRAMGVEYPDTLTAEQVVEMLNERFKGYFSDNSISARISDGILADASAGGDVVKIKQGATFSTRDVDILEVHEGWVHVGTSQNGNSQHVAKWLAKGPPRCAATQEGLAVIMEIFTFRTYPKRARAINDRVLAIDKAEDGANILDIIEFYRTEGYSEDESVANAKRVFRGGPLTGGAPFTKDIAYCRGFIENYNFMRAAIRAGRPELLPFLFCGKIHVDDIPLLYQKYREGIVDAPRYLPPQFRDLNGVTVWMSFSSFLNTIDLKTIQGHYDKLFEAHL